MIQKLGDMLAGHCNVYMHQCNCQGVMGVGLAANLKLRLPECYEADRNFPVPFGPGRLGKFSVARSMWNNLPVTVYNLYGQEKYGKGLQTDYKALREAFYGAMVDVQKSMRDVSMDEVSLLGSNLLKVAIPYKMGCGLAGGDWTTVTKIIEEVENLVGIEVYCYRLA